MGKYDVHTLDVIVGAGIVSVLYYLGHEPLAVLLGIVSGCVLIKLFRLDQ